MAGMDREERDAEELLVIGKLVAGAKELRAPLGLNHGDRELLTRICNAMALMFELQALHMRR